MEYNRINQKTLNENMDLFRSYIVAKANASNKEEKEVAYQHCLRELTNPAMISELKEYHKKTMEGGIFKSQEKLLENALTAFYKISYLDATGEQFTNKLINDPSFKKYIVNIEAKNLLSGTRIYSSEFAAVETKQLREKIQVQEIQLESLKTDNNSLTEKFSKLNKAFNNLVSNVKNYMGLEDETLRQFTQSHFNEISNVKEEDLRNIKSIGYLNTTESGALKQTTIYGQEKNKFIIKTELTPHTEDGYMTTTKPQFQFLSKTQVEALIENFKLQNVERNGFAAHAILHNLNSFITKKEQEELKPRPSLRV